MAYPRSDTTCICGRTFAKPFGMRVHQRSCPIERERSAAFVKAIEDGHPEDAYQAGERAAREKMAELGWSEESLEPAPFGRAVVQAALLAANDPELVELVVEINVDPKLWAASYDGDPEDFAGIGREAVRYVETILAAGHVDAFVSVSVKAI